MTLREFLEEKAEEIRAEAVEYAATHKVSMADALRDVRDGWSQGYCEGMEAMRTTDWDYGRE